MKSTAQQQPATPTTTYLASKQQQPPTQLHYTQHHHQQQQSKCLENLSFCGCGFLGIYHVGVASCLHEYAPQLSMHKIAGASAGAIVATAYICGNLHLAVATTDIMKVAIDARARGLGLPVGSFHPEFDINQLLLEALEKGLPDDVHLRVSGKLHISLTRYSDFANVVVSEFPSKADLIQVLLCSCFIPFWSGTIPPKYKGIAYVDGGLSNNLLVLDQATITVSPFSGEADVCPSDQMTNLVQIRLSNMSFLLTPTNIFRFFQVFFPPSPQKLSNLFQQGFDDAMRFLQETKLISCNKCSSTIVNNPAKPLSIETNCQQQQQDDSHHIAMKIHNEYDSDDYNDSEGHYLTSKKMDNSSNLCYGDEDNSTGIKDTPSLPSDDSKQEDCGECLYRRETALHEPLPKQFADIIREACDQVNKSLHNWIHTHKLGYLGYIPIVYYLPIDITLALFFRYWKKIPGAKDIGQSLLSMASEMSKKSSLGSLLNDKSGSFKLESYIEMLLLYVEVIGQQKN